MATYIGKCRVCGKDGYAATTGDRIMLCDSCLDELYKLIKDKLAESKPDPDVVAKYGIRPRYGLSPRCSKSEGT